jgi:glutamyl-tRNA synthetase
MNGQYLSDLPAAALVEPVRRRLGKLGVSLDGARLETLIDAVKARSRTVLQLADQIAVRADPGRIREDEKAASLRRKLGDAFAANLQIAAETLGAIPAPEWTAERLVATLKSSAESRGIKLGDLMQPIRVVLTGTTVSEPVNELLVAVGREEALRRLNGEQ